MTKGSQRFASGTQDSCLWKQQDLTQRLQRSESRLDTTRNQMAAVGEWEEASNPFKINRLVFCWLLGFVLADMGAGKAWP